MSSTMCAYNKNIFRKNDGASWWRVCYRWGLPRLVPLQAKTFYCLNQVCWRSVSVSCGNHNQISHQQPWARKTQANVTAYKSVQPSTSTLIFAVTSKWKISETWKKQAVYLPLYRIGHSTCCTRQNSPWCELCARLPNFAHLWTSLFASKSEPVM